MMLSSTLPHCSWELASYYRSTTRHAEYLLHVGYVCGCSQLYLVFTGFSHSSCVSSPMNLKDIWCFAVGWCYMMWRPKPSQWGQRDLQAILFHRLSWEAKNFILHMCMQTCVLSALQLSSRHLKGIPSASCVIYYKVIHRNSFISHKITLLRRLKTLWKRFLSLCTIKFSSTYLVTAWSCINYFSAWEIMLKFNLYFFSLLKWD